MRRVNRNIQVEETRNPRLKNIPLGMPSTLHILLITVSTCLHDCKIEHASYHAAVTQKYLIVTCNQAARRLGVTKLQGVTGAWDAHPHQHRLAIMCFFTLY